MRVRVDIERLVLEGVPVTGRERGALAPALEQELAFVLRDRPPVWPAYGAAVRRAQGGVVRAPTSGPEPGWTAAVAASIRDGIGRAVQQ